MKVKILTIHSRHKELERVISFIERFARRAHWPDSMRDRVLLAASEAATNAMEHGNKFDEKKVVTIEVSASDTAVVLAVQDQGTGFVRERVPDPLAMENLLRDSGRGLFIIEQLADGVSYHDSGRQIVLQFDWPSGQETEPDS